MAWMVRVFRQIESILYGAVHGAGPVRENDVLRTGSEQPQQDDRQLQKVSALMAQLRNLDEPAAGLNPFCPVCAGRKTPIKGHSCLISITNQIYALTREV